MSSLAIEVLAVEPGPRFLERIVTVEGTPPKLLTDPAGDTRGGVFTRGAGSLERAVCTLASRR